MAEKTERKDNVPAGFEEVSFRSVFEGASQYKHPLCFELAGRSFDLVFDNGREIIVGFLDGENLFLAENNVTEYHKYECLKCVNNICLVHLEKKGRWPREGLSLVLDLEKDLVTGNFLKQGAVKDYERLVTRDLQFGAIRIPGKPLPKTRHYYTEDLIGKKIEYTYNPEFSIVHIYQKGKCRAATPPALKKLGRSSVPAGFLFEEPSIYIKISEHVYVFSWIEENAKTGTQGFMLMDTARCFDVGLFFGINPKGKPESYMVSAIGKFVTEELPEETARSDFYK